MSVYSGRPVLAALGPERLPHIEYSNEAVATVAGLRAGNAAVMDLAIAHLPGDDPYDRAFADRVFAELVHEAREDDSYAYSRGFLAGAENALATLRGAIGGEL